MGINKLAGTPWHAERAHRGENDDRRYKGRCLFYSYEEEFCERYRDRCRGSAHCKYYKAISDEEFKERQVANQQAKKRAPKEDDCYWY